MFGRHLRYRKEIWPIGLALQSAIGLTMVYLAVGLAAPSTAQDMPSTVIAKYHLSEPTVSEFSQAGGFHPLQVASDTATFTPTPTHTPTATATFTLTLSPTPSETPTNTPMPSPMPTATDLPTATPTSTPSATPSPTSTPLPSATPTASATPTSTETATPSPSPTNTPSPTLTQTATATPTSTATPTATPVPCLITGVVFIDFNRDSKRRYDEPGLPDILIQLQASDGAARFISTQADGSFDFEGVPPDQYVITVNEPPDYRIIDHRRSIDRRTCSSETLSFPAQPLKPMPTPTATPSVMPTVSPTDAPYTACKAIRLYGDSGTTTGTSVKDPVTDQVVEDRPYTQVAAPFDPRHAQAPAGDFLTWNPAWLSAIETPDENWELYTKLQAGTQPAAAQVWFRQWYEPQHWDLDLNANGILDDADISYPAVMQEFTYMLMDSRNLATARPGYGPAGNTTLVFPIGQTSVASQTPADYGLASLSPTFDNHTAVVHVESERSLAALTGVEVDLNGNGQIDSLDSDQVRLSGDELVVLRLAPISLAAGMQIQFLDHTVVLSEFYRDRIKVEIFYTGNATREDVGPVDLFVGDMALAGDRYAGPPEFIRAGSQYIGKVPPGAWFIWLKQMNITERVAQVVLGRALGATHSAMQAGSNLPNTSVGDFWFLKRFYVGGHEYNVTAIQAQGDEFQYITLRTPLPIVPVTITRNGVDELRLHVYRPGQPLPVLPPYNYSHYLVEAISASDGLAESGDPVPAVGKLIGPVPAIQPRQNGSAIPRQVYQFYVQAGTGPSALGELGGLPGVRPGGELWYSVQTWTRPSEYLSFCLPDLPPGLTGAQTPDLYLVASSFHAPHTRSKRWFPISNMPVTSFDDRVLFWFDPDPETGGEKYIRDNTVRLYGYPSATAGDSNARDPGDPNYPVAVAPYTDTWAVFNPQLSQAPAGDSITLNPAYMARDRHGLEPLYPLYSKISIDKNEGREKVYARFWYEPAYRARIGVDPGQVITFPALIQEMTYQYLDEWDQPGHAPAGRSQFAFPIATDKDQLPAPVNGTVNTVSVGYSFGHGLTGFDADFDGKPEAVQVESEHTLYEKTGLQADFNGDGVLSDLDGANPSDGGSTLVVFAVTLNIKMYQSVQFLVYLARLNYLTPGGDVGLEVWYAGGGRHNWGNNIFAQYPDLISSPYLREKQMVIARDKTVTKFVPDYRPVNTGGAWFAYVDKVDPASNSVNLIVGRALGASRPAVDDSTGGHDLVPDDPWYLKRFFVDGHEYNVVAIKTVATPQGLQFQSITLRSPIPIGRDVSIEEYQVLQGYTDQPGLRYGEDPTLVPLAPPFNVEHTRLENTRPLNPWEFANPSNYVENDMRISGQVPPVILQLVEQGREKSYLGQLAGFYASATGLATEQWQVNPDNFLRLRLQPIQRYALTTGWRSATSRIHLYGVYGQDQHAVTQRELHAAHPELPAPNQGLYYQASPDADQWLRATFILGEDPATPEDEPSADPYVNSWQLTFPPTPTPTPTPSPTATPTPTPTPTVTPTRGVLKLSPSPLYVTQYMTETVDVIIQEVPGFQKLLFVLLFDNSTVIDVDKIQVTPGPCPGPNTKPQIDKTANRIFYSVTLDQPAKCSGTVASITLQGKAEGTSRLLFEVGEIRDAHRDLVDHDNLSGNIVVIRRMGVLTGQVLLSSRRDFSGTLIQASPLFTTTTDNTGFFKLELPPGNYVITATHTSYLTGVHSDVGVTTDLAGIMTAFTNTLGCIKLIGGDVNGDQEIGLSDLVLIGANYGHPAHVAPSADIDGSGKIDIIDLTQVGINYGRIGPKTEICNPGMTTSLTQADSFP